MKTRIGGAEPLAAIASTLRVTCIAAAVVLAFWLLSDVLLLIFFAVLLGVVLRGLADWLAARTGLRPRATLAIVSVGLAVLFLGLCYYAGPRFVDQGQQLWTQLSGQFQSLRRQYGGTAWGHLLFQRITPSTQGGGSAIARSAETVATSTVGTLASAFVLIVSALYFAIAPSLYVGGLVRLVPLTYRPRARQILDDVAHTLRWWMLGQAIDMLVVGVLSGIGLILLGVPMPFALAVIAGLFTFVPYFGAIAAAVPAVLVALSVGWYTALWVAVVYVVCHIVEGYVVAPLVQRRTVELPPALTILSMTVLGAVFGILGVILATPLAAVGLVIVREAYVEDVLEGQGSALDPPGAEPLDLILK